MSFIKVKILHPLKMLWYEVQIQLRGTWSFFCKQQQLQERALQKKYYNVINETDYNHTVIFTCNGFIWHGGLADRFKGIIALYEWCKRNNRIFKINFCSPFLLQDYLVPNRYNWISNEIIYDKFKSKPCVFLMEPRTCGREDFMKKRDLLIEKWLNAKLNDTNCQLHVYTNIFRDHIEFSQLFNELFKPCERLQKDIAYHKSQIQNSTYISISFRFTTLLGDFNDCTNLTLSKSEQEEYIRICINAIRDIHNEAPIHEYVLITADSISFLNRVKTELKDIKTYIIPGKVGHIDYNYNDDVNMKTFLDFLMIADAEAVYLVKYGKMYGSEFAKTAAMVNNKKFEIKYI